MAGKDWDIGKKSILMNVLPCKVSTKSELLTNPLAPIAAVTPELGWSVVGFRCWQALG